MGYITTPLFNILRTSGEDITTPAGIYAAAMDTVFNTEGILAPISEQYRQQLVTGFALHYFRDEIGQETVPLFKMSVNEKIWNNAAEINSIFENLDKQIYARYAVHRADRHDVTSDVSNSNENGQSNEASAFNSHDINNDNVQGNRIHSDSQNSQSKQLQNEAGSDSRHNASQSIGHDAQSSSNTEHGTDNNLQTGGYTDAHSNATTQTSQGETDSNSVSASLDTPQGSISAIRTPSGGTPASLKGAGVDAELSAPYRYLTGASSSDGTTVNRDTSQNNEAGITKHTNDNLASNTTSDRQSNGASNGHHDQNIQGDEISQNARQAQTVGEDNLQTAGNEQTSQQSNGEAIRQTADAKQSQDNRQRTENKAGTSDGTDNAVDYELTNEMLNNYIPLMSRIWKIFDPCFCLLLD